MFQIIALVVTLMSPFAFTTRVGRVVRNGFTRRLSSWVETPQVEVPVSLRPSILAQDLWKSKRDNLEIDVWSGETRESLSKVAITKVRMYGIPSRRRYIIEDLDGRESSSVDWNDPRRRTSSPNAETAGASLQKVVDAMK